MPKSKPKPRKAQSIQSKGGSARAASMTPDQRKALAREAAESRWANRPDEPKVPRATHAGTLRIGNAELPCANLPDGRRVISESAMMSALGREYSGYYTRTRDAGQTASEVLPHYLAPKALKPFVSEELSALLLRPIPYRTATGSLAKGVVAEALPQICDVWLKAREAGVLTEAMQRTARAAEVIVRGLATVGIVALVDEATGYQKDRDRDELHRLLAQYIAKELLPWTRRFPDEFYKEMFRLRGWKAFDHNAAQGPRFAGKLTNQLVYERLPPGVLKELQDKNPATNNRRRHAHHQFLTETIGNPHLERHIASVTTLMRAARTWAELEDLANRALPPRALPSPDVDPQLRNVALDE